MIHFPRIHGMLLAALLLVLLLPAPGAAAVAPPPPPPAAAGAGINWLQAVTDQVNHLVTADAATLVDIGYIELYFIAIFTLITMVSRWQLSHMVVGFRPVNFHIGDLILFLVQLSICSALLHYYLAPFPGSGLKLYQLPDAFGKSISGTLDMSIVDDFYHRVTTALNSTNKPGGLNFLGILIYIQVIGNLAFASLIMFAVNTFGFVAYGMFVLFGPLIIPLYLTNHFRSKFWGWVDHLIVFGMYRAVSAALTFVWLNVLVSFFDNTVNGDYSIGHWLALIPTLLMLTVSFGWTMFKIPAVTSMLFGGAGAGAQAATDAAVAKLVELAHAALL